MAREAGERGERSERGGERGERGRGRRREGGGDDREQELTFNNASSPALQFGAWTSLEIPLSSFTGLTTRGHVSQLIISGDVGTAYVDNIYFHK